MLNSIVLSNHYNTGVIENSISLLTPNTIILCQDHNIKRDLSGHMLDNLRGFNGLVLSRNLKPSDVNFTDEDSSSYSISTDYVDFNIPYDYYETTQFVLDESEFDYQSITITTELSYVLAVESVLDLWFAANSSDGTVKIYALSDFSDDNYIKFRQVDDINIDVYNLMHDIYIGKYGCWNPNILHNNNYTDKYKNESGV